jgi:nicotinic acid mononucleotide adenylyltransferase
VAISDGDDVTTEHVVFKTKTREQQEVEISQYIDRYCNRSATSVVFSGSFDPFHCGHKYLVDEIAHKYAGDKPVTLDISTTHPTKGFISEQDIESRLKSIGENKPLTRYCVDVGNRPMYIDKFHYYRGKFGNNNILFVIGEDVWYDNHDNFLEVFKDHMDNVKFLVVARYSVKSDTFTPDKFRPLLHPDSFKITPPKNILGLSSTLIRLQELHKNVCDLF